MQELCTGRSGFDWHSVIHCSVTLNNLSHQSLIYHLMLFKRLNEVMHRKAVSDQGHHCYEGSWLFTSLKLNENSQSLFYSKDITDLCLSLPLWILLFSQGSRFDFLLSNFLLSFSLQYGLLFLIDFWGFALILFSFCKIHSSQNFGNRFCADEPQSFISSRSVI